MKIGKILTSQTSPQKPFGVQRLYLYIIAVSGLNWAPHPDSAPNPTLVSPTYSSQSTHSFYTFSSRDFCTVLIYIVYWGANDPPPGGLPDLPHRSPLGVLRGSYLEVVETIPGRYFTIQCAWLVAIYRHTKVPGSTFLLCAIYNSPEFF